MRYYYNRKATAEESYDVSIFRLKKQGMLSGCKSTAITWTSSLTGKEGSIGLTIDMTAEEPYARFNYTTTNKSGDSTEHEYRAYLINTNCNYGGIRWWFACPGCGRRVGVLYMVPGNNRFFCRHCNNLSYHSRNETHPLGILGITEREIKRLRSEIKRWTWRGRPTRKVRRLQALERKMGMLLGPIRARLDKLKASIR